MEELIVAAMSFRQTNADVVALLLAYPVEVLGGKIFFVLSVPGVGQALVPLEELVPRPKAKPKSSNPNPRQLAFSFGSESDAACRSR